MRTSNNEEIFISRKGNKINLSLGSCDINMSVKEVKKLIEMLKVAILSQKDGYIDENGKIK